MCNMQELYLHYNQIGDAGLSALADALGKGALPKCTYIDVDENPASEEALQAVQEALEQR